MVKNIRTLARSVLFVVAAAAAYAPLATARAEFANPDGVAVIVGNRYYVNDRVPPVDFAHRDAEAFKRYVLDVLGFDPVNIIDLRDATKAKLEMAFGNEREHGYKGLVWRYLSPEGGSDVVVFYSGHGVPGLKDGRGYLLPTDAHVDTAEINGYPIDVLYGNLAKLAEARSVAVYLDACFSGDSHRGMLVRSASPVYLQANIPAAGDGRLTVLTAASKTQLASWDESAGHGMFTHHLLDALYGKGDRDRDGRVTAREVKRYLDRHMTRAARRQYGREQEASLGGASETVVSRASEAGFPARPLLDTVVVAPDDPETVGAGTRAGEPAGDAKDASLGPVELAAAREMTLDLARADRTMVQRSLASLGFDVGAADGKFGPRTRGAIRDYQAANGTQVTGFLTRGEVDALVAAVADAERREAARRAEEARLAAAARLERERLAKEQARRAEEERLARERLAAEERRRAQERRAEERRADEAAFAFARRLDTIEGFEQYRRSHPQGLRIADAIQRETELREDAARREVRERLERERLAAEQRRRAEQAAFARAKRVATIAGYDDYLRAHGNAGRSGEIRRLRSAAVRRLRERAPGRKFRECRECPEMVVVPAGSYRMGSPSSEEGSTGKERPAHRVTLSKSFAVGVHEVTFREWEACHQGGGCSHRPRDRGWGRGNHPVINVSWEDAQEFLRWLSKKTGKPYRLPSEAEWEYAARGGTTGPFHFGSTILPEQANYDGRSAYGSGRKGLFRGRTVPVGSFSSNAYGLHDVHGNVWEWVEDCWHRNYREAPSDGRVWTRGGDCNSRVLRGGSWGLGPMNVRSARRYKRDSVTRFHAYGFRVARTLD